MTRRALLLASCAGMLRADAAQEVYALFGDMTAALSGYDAVGFMAHCDKSMAGYQKLRENVTALLRIFLLECNLEFSKNEGDDRKRQVEIDWLMLFHPVGAGTFSQPEAMATSQREQMVKCTVAKQGRKWKVMALDPIDFFAPPQV